mmetsp:Transcript_53272/g.133739  ORF Transcript_53272/g.133739 Transcript_53272/m.133739 type:complete len:846 (-) Transcript_53272:86-2623(-)
MGGEGKAPNEQRVAQIINDLVSKEMAYMKYLQALKFVILQPLKDAIVRGNPVISEEDVSLIFPAQLESFLSLSQSLFYDLLTHQEQCAPADIAPTIARVFVKQGDFLKIYRDFIANTGQYLEAVTKSLKKSQAFSYYLEQKYALLRQNNIHDNLVSLLCRPSRQVPIYLQCMEMLQKEYGPHPDIDAGLDKIKSVLNSIGKSSEEEMKRTEMKKIAALQSRLIGRLNVMDDNRRHIVHEETLTLIKDKAGEQGLMHLVLFNDSLLVTTPHDNNLILERFVPLQFVSMESPAKQDDKYEKKTIFDIDVFGWQYCFKSPSTRSKDVWFHQMNECMKTLPALVVKTMDAKGTGAGDKSPRVASKSPRAAEKAPEKSPRADADNAAGSSKEAAVPPEAKSDGQAARTPDKTEAAAATNPDAGAEAASSPVVSPLDIIQPRSKHRRQPSRASASPRPAPTRRLPSRPANDTYQELVEMSIELAGPPALLLETNARLNPKTGVFEDVVGAERCPVILSKDGAIIGREVGYDEKKLVLLVMDDENISRRNESRLGHGEISYTEKDGFILRDLGSTNGTFVLDPSTKKVIKQLVSADSPSEWHPIEEGDEFQMGGTRFIVSRVLLERVQAADFVLQSSLVYPAPRPPSPIPETIESEKPEASPAASSPAACDGSGGSQAAAQPRRRIMSSKKGQHRSVMQYVATVKLDPSVLDFEPDDDFEEDQEQIVRPSRKLLLGRAANPSPLKTFKRFISSTESDGKGRGVEIFIGGMEDNFLRTVIPSSKTRTFLDVKKKIYELALSDDERKLVKSHDGLSVKINGRVPITANQNNQKVASYFFQGQDLKLLVSLPVKN